MKRKLHALPAIILLLFVPLAAQAAGRRVEETHPATVARVKRAVVILNAYDERGKMISQGSGFFVAPGRVITNAHVINTASRAQIQTFDGHIYDARGVIAVDARQDLALVEFDVPQPARSVLTTLALEADLPAWGEEVFVVSNPRGALSWTVSSGAALATWQFDGIGALLRITSPIARGSSGGPVVNLDGRVVGVATMCLKRSEELYFAVPARNLSALRPGSLMPFPLKEK